MKAETKEKAGATPGPWWARRAGQGEPVVYMADVERLKRDATELRNALRLVLSVLHSGAPSYDTHADVRRARALLARLETP